MAVFTDVKHRVWELAIDGFIGKRIREQCDPNFLLNDFDDKQINTYARIQSDPFLACEVLFILCDKQREERGISVEDFYMNVIGEVIGSAEEALLEAIINFIPPRQSQMLKMFAEQDQMRKKATEKIVSRLNDPGLREEVMAKLEAEIDAKVETLVMQLSSVLSTPVSSESTPKD